MIDDEDAAARLLRLAGPRPVVPAERRARVRAAVRDDWRGATRRRRVIRGGVIVAVVAILGVGVALIPNVLRRDAPSVATARAVASVERTEGLFPLAPGTAIHEGATLVTKIREGVALRLTDGTSLRIDAGSRVRLVSATIIELRDGALYVDTGRDSTGIEIRTALGIARDIGTQFDVRLSGKTLRVRVRTGIVELSRSDGVRTARAGMELRATPQETVIAPIAGHGPEWAWAAALGPRFEIEGRSVAAFLEHLSREQGWSLRYSDAALARDASSIILHGSIAGLEPEDALAVALQSSNLAHEVRDGELVVRRRGARDAR